MKAAQPSAPVATVIGSESGFNYGVSATPFGATTQANPEARTLLPQQPRNRCCCCTYESSVVTFNPYTITQTYKIKNRNMYSLTLDNLDLQVTSNLAGGDVFVGHGTFVGNDSSVTIPKNSDKEVSIIYLFNSTASEDALARQACFSFTGVKYETSGTIEMKTWSTDFKNVGLGPWTVTYFC